MSTWELPLGYGRSKPDVMAYGRDVQARCCSPIAPIQLCCSLNAAASLLLFAPALHSPSYLPPGSADPAFDELLKYHPLLPSPLPPSAGLPHQRRLPLAVWHQRGVAGGGGRGVPAGQRGAAGAAVRHILLPSVPPSWL